MLKSLFTVPSAKEQFRKQHCFKLNTIKVKALRGTTKSKTL